MKTLLSFLLCTSVLTARADELRRFDWREQTLTLGGMLQDGGVLAIANTNETPLRVELLRIENPGVSAQTYALRGRIKYAGVQGEGFLEMWNVFPGKEGGPEGRYFSRTMAPAGTMGKIAGTSDWREFELPFNRTGSPAPPKRLELNLILPGKGTVLLESPQLIEYRSGVGGPSAVWWSDRTAGIIGGIAGSLIGCLGSVLGLLSAKRRAKGFVLGTAYAMIAFGCALGVAALAAVSLRQPYAVWFPLVLGAVLLLSIMPTRLRSMRRLYADQELRRMAALDAGS